MDSAQLGTASDPWHYPRPELAGRFVQNFDMGLSSARGIFARRRMGKTEFLQKDLMPAAAQAGYLTAYVNLWTSRSNPEAALIESIGQASQASGLRRVAQLLKTPVKKLKASGKLPGLAEGALEAELGATGQHSPPLALQHVFRQFDATGKKLLLILDEAQVLAAADHTNLTHALRAALDERKAIVKVVFAGSSEATLRRMFAKPSEPFYNWAALEPFELLGPEFVRALVRKVNEITRFPLHAEDALQAFKELNETPEFLRRYLERYLNNPQAGSGAALQDTKAHVFDDKNFLLTWQSLLPADQELLRLMAQGAEDLHGAAVRERLGRALGLDKAVPLSTPQNSLRRLQASTVVTRLDAGTYRFEDDAFEQWVRLQALDDPVQAPAAANPPQPATKRPRRRP